MIFLMKWLEIIVDNYFFFDIFLVCHYYFFIFYIKLTILLDNLDSYYYSVFKNQPAAFVICFLHDNNFRCPFFSCRIPLGEARLKSCLRTCLQESSLSNELFVFYSLFHLWNSVKEKQFIVFRRKCDQRKSLFPFFV